MCHFLKVSEKWRNPPRKRRIARPGTPYTPVKVSAPWECRKKKLALYGPKEKARRRKKISGHFSIAIPKKSQKCGRRKSPPCRRTVQKLAPKKQISGHFLIAIPKKKPKMRPAQIATLSSNRAKAGAPRKKSGHFFIAITKKKAKNEAGANRHPVAEPCKNWRPEKKKRAFYYRHSQKKAKNVAGAKSPPCVRTAQKRVYSCLKQGTHREIGTWNVIHWEETCF